MKYPRASGALRRPRPHAEKGSLRSHNAAVHRRQFRTVTIWGPPLDQILDPPLLSELHRHKTLKLLITVNYRCWYCVTLGLFEIHGWHIYQLYYSSIFCVTSKIATYAKKTFNQICQSLNFEKALLS